MVERKGVDCLNFKQIKEIVDENKLELLGRAPDAQLVYRAFMDDIVKRDWESIGDFILASKFGLPVKSAGPTGRKYVPIATKENGELAADIKTPVIKLLKNDFPYNFEPNVEHFILWKIFEPLNQSDIDSAIKELTNDDPQVPVTFYVNPAHLKSVLDIDHAHIILKNPS